MHPPKLTNTHPASPAVELLRAAGFAVAAPTPGEKNLKVTSTRGEVGYLFVEIDPSQPGKNSSRFDLQPRPLGPRGSGGSKINTLGCVGLALESDLSDASSPDFIRQMQDAITALVGVPPAMVRGSSGRVHHVLLTSGFLTDWEDRKLVHGWLSTHVDAAMRAAGFGGDAAAIVDRACSGRWKLPLVVEGGPVLRDAGQAVSAQTWADLIDRVRAEIPQKVGAKKSVRAVTSAPTAPGPRSSRPTRTEWVADPAAEAWRRVTRALRRAVSAPVGRRRQVANDLGFMIGGVLPFLLPKQSRLLQGRLTKVYSTFADLATFSRREFDTAYGQGLADAPPVDLRSIASRDDRAFANADRVCARYIEGAILAADERSARSILVSSDTGTGKTYALAALDAAHPAEGLVVVVPNTTLVQSIADDLIRARPALKSRIQTQFSRPGPLVARGKVTVVCVGSIARVERAEGVTLAVDEADKVLGQLHAEFLGGRRREQLTALVGLARGARKALYMSATLRPQHLALFERVGLLDRTTTAVVVNEYQKHSGAITQRYRSVEALVATELTPQAIEGRRVVVTCTSRRMARALALYLDEEVPDARYCVITGCGGGVQRAGAPYAERARHMGSPSLDPGVMSNHPTLTGLARESVASAEDTRHRAIGAALTLLKAGDLNVLIVNSAADAGLNIDFDVDLAVTIGTQGGHHVITSVDSLVQAFGRARSAGRRAVCVMDDRYRSVPARMQRDATAAAFASLALIDLRWTRAAFETRIGGLSGMTFVDAPSADAGGFRARWRAWMASARDATAPAELADELVVTDHLLGGGLGALALRGEELDHLPDLNARAAIEEEQAFLLALGAAHLDALASASAIRAASTDADRAAIIDAIEERDESGVSSPRAHALALVEIGRAFDPRPGVTYRPNRWGSIDRLDPAGRRTTVDLRGGLTARALGTSSRGLRAIEEAARALGYALAGDRRRGWEFVRPRAAAAVLRAFRDAVDLRTMRASIRSFEITPNPAPAQKGVTAPLGVTHGNPQFSQANL